MTQISDDELRQRLGAVKRGPWSKALVEARRKLAPLGELKTSRGPAGVIDLSELYLSASDKKKNRRLATVLRPHFEDENGITDPIEIETRETLDQALNLPQLLELAVQSGYLPAERVRNPARKMLVDLLWSPAARDFVATYDYLGVSMLAARVGVIGIGEAQPPEPNANSALRFAGFLAHLRAFYADEQIQTWTNFLDDYIVETDEQEIVWLYLKGQREERPVRIMDLLSGCQFFVTSLASAFNILDDDELGRFGLIHSYWLQKFFGYELNRGGHVKNIDLWGSSDSWANTIANSPHLVSREIDADIAKLFRRQFREQVQVLKRTFNAIRSLSKSARQASALSQATAARYSSEPRIATVEE